jgi:hypothetical protein
MNTQLRLEKSDTGFKDDASRAEVEFQDRIIALTRPETQKIEITRCEPQYYHGYHYILGLVTFTDAVPEDAPQELNHIRGLDTN